MLFPELHSKARNSMKPSRAFIAGLYRRLFRKPKEKVFVIGFHKTGTSSLGKALQMLGYKVCGSLKEGYDFTSQEDPVPEYLISKAKPLLNSYDAFQDTPWFLLYHQLYELYPNARFILTEREEKAWLKSVQGHFGRDAYPYHAYIYGTVDSIANGDVYLKKYREHNAAVRNYFYDKPGQLLIIDLPNLRQPWSVISEFLDVKRPKFSFPHANKEDSRGKLTTRLKKLLKKYYYSS